METFWTAFVFVSLPFLAIGYWYALYSALKGVVGK